MYLEVLEMLRYRKFEEEITNNTEKVVEIIKSEILELRNNRSGLDQVTYSIKAYYPYKVCFANELGMVKRYNEEMKIWAIMYLKLQRFGKKIPVFINDLTYLLQKEGLEFTFDYKGVLVITASTSVLLKQNAPVLKNKLK